MQPVAKRFEDVALPDAVGGLNIGRRASDTPRTMKSSSGEPALLSPALERLPGPWIESGRAPKARRIQLRVEAALALELAAARSQDALPDCDGCLALRF